jgi:hypothetical protein
MYIYIYPLNFGHMFVEDRLLVGAVAGLDVAARLDALS